VEVVASLSQGRTAAAQCGLFAYKSVPVIFEPPCTINFQFQNLSTLRKISIYFLCSKSIRRTQNTAQREA